MTELYYTKDGWRNSINKNIHHREKIWNYKGKAIYHITLTVEDRYPLFGKLIGDTPDSASVWLNEMGLFVDKTLRGLPIFYSSKGVDIRILALKVMPDHLHVVIHVKQDMPKTIGEIIRSFKSFCTSHFKKEYFQKINQKEATESQATESQATESQAAESQATRLKNEPEMKNQAEEKAAEEEAKSQAAEEEAAAIESVFVHFCRIFATAGTIWESMPSGYHERILHCDGQLDRMIKYVKDNPRRLWLKKKYPNLFRIRNNQQLLFTDNNGNQSSIRFRALGNIFLLDYPMKQQIQCSRSLKQEDIEAYKQRCEQKAIQGYVSVTPAISEGEKTSARYLREQDYPLIILLKDGFPKEGSPHEKYFKPGGIYFDACAEGRMLLLEPYDDFLNNPEIEKAINNKTPNLPKDTQRYFFLALNKVAEVITQTRYGLQARK